MRKNRHRLGADSFAEAFVGRQVDDPRAASAELPQDPVGPHRRARDERVRRDLALDRQERREQTPDLRPCTACSRANSSTPTGILVSNWTLAPGHEHFNVFSTALCLGGPGSGPFGGLCYANTADLFALLALPLGAVPFHYLAPAAGVTFGPYPIVAGLSFDALCADVTGGLTLSPVVRFTVQ